MTISVKQRFAGISAAVLVVGPALLVPTPADAAAPGNRGQGGNTPLEERVLTSEGSDRYSIKLSKGVLRMSAPSTNTGNNLREVFWPVGQSPAADSQVCATWTDQSSPYVQQGLALRVVGGPAGTRAVTVTKSVWGGAFFMFNVHTWDSASPQPFTLVGQHDMSAVVWQNGQPKPLPWRVCARAVGSQLTFKVWLPDSEAEPTWDDPVHTGTTTLPADYLVPGNIGWYVGHIPAGGSARYEGLGIWQPPPA